MLLVVSEMLYYISIKGKCRIVYNIIKFILKLLFNLLYSVKIEGLDNLPKMMDI